jgi:hypothetical protein
MHMTSQRATTILWRPTGPKELDLVRQLNWRAWPPSLPEQPILYPVLNEDYPAAWLLPAGGGIERTTPVRAIEPVTVPTPGRPSPQGR